jgi:hypothetical protein
VPGIIEKSAVDGQMQYHDALDKAMRAYIAEHRAEFLPEGVDEAAVEAAAEASPEPAHGALAADAGAGPSDAQRARERERSQRGLQWAYDTFAGAFKVARTSTEGALDLLGDAWEQSSGGTLLYGVIALLVLSNAWTLAMVGRREDAGRRRALHEADDRERLVRSVLAGLWQDVATGKLPPPPVPAAAAPVAAPHAHARGAHGAHGEVADLHAALDAIEQRVRALRQGLAEALVEDEDVEFVELAFEPSS